MSQRIGVCSWSLRPPSAEELVRNLKAIGVSATQLALDPLRLGDWQTDHTIACLRDAGIEVRSGMIGMKGENYSSLDSIRRTGGVRLDEHWEYNAAAAEESAALAARMKVGLVTLHAGFLPHERNDPSRSVMIERLRVIVDCFADQGVKVGFETGQETADTLLAVLAELDRPSVGVNFDPANMILYAMGDPVAALKALAPHVVQIHIKDALATEKPGTWGKEVPAGDGAVDWPAFFDVVRASQINCDLMVERETPGDRVAEIRQACHLAQRLLMQTGSTEK